MPPFVQEPISHLVIVATIVLSLAGLPTPQSTSADELPKESVLPLGTATKAIQAALDACKKDGYRVSVSVVDRAGVLCAMGRADGAGSHTVDSSRKKAYTAASLRRPTSELADLIIKVPTLQALRDMNGEILILGGGLPIEISGEVIGGIGVGGAPGAHLDDTCAQEGLNAIGAASKVPASK
ncbi:MAG: heme-binding protein [Nitrospira sp.]|nr:MAG: heme-binding protein [Nitrospira sp.]